MVLLSLPLGAIAALPLTAVLALAWAGNAGLPLPHIVLAAMAVLALLHLRAVARMLAGYRTEATDVEPWPVMRRADAHALFAVLDSVAATRRLPPIDQVWIHDECNASISVERRWRQGTTPALRVTFGFPLLVMLSPEQLRAVIAHELGHVGGTRAVLHSLLARLLAVTSGDAPHNADTRYARSVWRLVAWVGRLCGPVTGRCWRRLSHSCEYRADRADRAAAQCCGGARVAQTLAMIGLAKHTLSTIWWPLFFPADATSAAPEGRPFAGLLLGDLRWPDASERSYWLDEALLCGVAPLPTHPRLSDRLGMLGGTNMPVLHPIGEGCSALSVLVPMQTSNRLADALDRRWPADVADAWEEHVARCERLRQERDHLLCRRSTQVLPARALERLGWLQRELADAGCWQTLNDALASGDQDLAVARSMLIERAIDCGDRAAATALLDECAGQSIDMDRHCRRWQLRLLHGEGAEDSRLAPLRRAVAADALADHAESIEWGGVGADSIFEPFEMADHVLEDFRCSMQRVQAIARSVSLLRQRSRWRSDRHRLVVVVVPDAGLQETLLDRLRIRDSHQRLRCTHLLEAVQFPGGLAWVGTVEMPDSRLAGRVARGKAFARMI
ncbi:M48 family metallopeptidase [Stenotrophomonas maltophilia]|uniref:M48 family metallopeptidase n=1 Tax=Stenotrophomonas maltophilia TaxID=40324 RepID=UPI0013DA16E2|nr:M48 family metallopeptidase [Stenotrophomonas maltophilia]MBH1429036.1 M48 family metallopeptidase [Stenotrophomonas maltophilia]HDS1568053.1 M48 family metallopeptidase [Stenotrophomonas maltophilia]